MAVHFHLLFEPKASDSAHGLLLGPEAWTGLLLGVLLVWLFVKGVRLGPIRGEELHSPGFFKFVTHEESIVFCLHPLLNSPQSRGVNRCSCSHPQKARLPVSEA